jgi:LuxR family maltose regulon positive regulatory protein
MPKGSIPRPKILRRLQEGLADGHTLTLISAGAGFGKTCCASEWAGRLERPSAWLSLDVADDDPGRFFLYLIAALQQIDPAIGRGIDGVLRGGSLPDAGILHTTISNDIVESASPFILFLDDFQWIQDPVILQVMEWFAVSPPPPLHLALITREDPPLPLARLRANGRLSEIRAADLQFSAQEAGEYLNGILRLGLSPANIHLLDKRTEGWVVGLHLAGLSIRDRKDPAVFIAGLSGGHRPIAAYLTEEILDRQTPKTQDFLLKTSILEQLTGGLCDAVTGRADGAAMLERLYRANLFLAPLDEAGHWFRYHPLFVETLRIMSGARPKEDSAVLNRRACEWFIRQEMVPEAVRHALAAEEYGVALRQIEAHAMDMLMQWHVKTVDGWVRAIPPEWMAQSIQANLAMAWIFMIHSMHDRAAPYLARLPALFAESTSGEREDPILNAKWMAIQAMMHNARGQGAQGAALCRTALDRTPEDESPARCMIYLGLAGACGQMDDRSGEEEAFREIIRHGRGEGDTVYELLGISGLALSAIRHGKLHFAFELAAGGIARMEAAGSLPPVATAVYGELGTICYQWHRLDEADEYFRRAIQVGELAGFSDSRLFHGVILSRLQLIEGRTEAAEREIRQTAALMRVEAPIFVREEIVAQQARVLLALGKPADAERLLQAEGFSFTGGFSAPDPSSGRAAGPFFSAALRVLLHRANAGGGRKGAREGLALADRLIERAARREEIPFELELLLLRAQLHDALGEDDRARSDLRYALELGEEEGFIGVFVDEGKPIADAVAGLLRGKDHGNASPEYVRRVLDAFSCGRSAESAADGGGTERLTVREREVLRLLAEGLRYEEVAERLVVSLNTVRSHVKTIYGKLGVNNRTRAIEIAQRDNLL